MLQWRPFNEIPELMKKQKRQNSILSINSSHQEENISPPSPTATTTSTCSIASQSPSPSPSSSPSTYHNDYFAPQHYQQKQNTVLPRLYGMEYTFKEMPSELPSFFFST
jgi:hypothetical protein